MNEFGKSGTAGNSIQAWTLGSTGPTLDGLKRPPAYARLLRGPRGYSALADETRFNFKLTIIKIIYIAFANTEFVKEAFWRAVKGRIEAGGARGRLQIWLESQRLTCAYYGHHPGP